VYDIVADLSDFRKQLEIYFSVKLLMFISFLLVFSVFMDCCNGPCLYRKRRTRNLQMTDDDDNDDDDDDDAQL